MGARLPRERKTGGGGSALAKETKPGVKVVRKSECLVVPMKRGNAASGPRGGKGAPEHGTEGGKDGGDTEPYNRLNETPTDSDAGEQLIQRRVREGVSPTRSETMSRGAGCGNSARPDLWGAGVGNCPGLPDVRQVKPG